MPKNQLPHEKLSQTPVIISPPQKTNDPKIFPGCIFKSHLWDITQPNLRLSTYEMYKTNKKKMGKWWRKKSVVSNFSGGWKITKVLLSRVVFSHFLVSQHIPIRVRVTTMMIIMSSIVCGVMQIIMFHPSHFVMKSTFLW